MRSHCIDPQRVYVAGPVIAASAAVSARDEPSTTVRCPGRRPVTRTVHRTPDDRVVADHARLRCPACVVGRQFARLLHRPDRTRRQRGSAANLSRASPARLSPRPCLRPERSTWPAVGEGRYTGRRGPCPGPQRQRAAANREGSLRGRRPPRGFAGLRIERDVVHRRPAMLRLADSLAMTTACSRLRTARAPRGSRGWCCKKRQKRSASTRK